MKYGLVISILAAASLAACSGGGGGGGGSTGGGGGTVPQAASVSGDMLNLAPSRGWNYTGNIGNTAFTLTLYADPPSGGSTTLAFLSVLGTHADATNGFNNGTVTVVNNNGYQVTAYRIYNSDGSVYSQGALSNPQLVLSTLTQGESSTPYPGATATVVLVGTVPGGSACPTPAQGATVQYTFMGQTYSISYVPGCGVTHYVGNHGETFTLTSIGSYPGLGTLSTARGMQSLTLWDTAKSLTNILITHEKWHSALVPH